MGLDPMRVTVAAHRLGSDLALGSEARMPPNGGRHAHPEALRRSPTRRTILNGGDHPLA